MIADFTGEEQEARGHPKEPVRGGLLEGCLGPCPRSALMVQVCELSAFSRGAIPEWTAVTTIPPSRPSGRRSGRIFASSAPPARPAGPSGTSSRCSPTRPAGSTWDRPQLRHRRRRGPRFPDARIRRPSPDGMGRLRPPGRKRGDRPGSASRPLDAREHRLHERPAQEAGPFLRLVARGDHLRARVLQMEPVVLPQDARSGAGLQEGLGRQLVPLLRNGPRERAGGGRALLAVRRGGRSEGALPMVLQDHGLRRGAPSGLRPADGMAGARSHDAEELDRQIVRRRGPVSAGRTGSGGEGDRNLHDAAGYALRRHVHESGP